MVDRQLPFQERACFWWADETVVAPAFAAEKHVFGTLSISENGQTEVELDGVMPTDQHPFVENLSRIEPKADISGLTIRTNEYFRLINPTISSRSANSGGFSHQKWDSFLCLMRLGSVLTDKDLNYSTLQVSLDGFEEWLGTRTPMPKFKRGPRVSLNHVGRKNVVYSLDYGSITIDFDISITYTGSGGTEFILKQKPTMTYRFRKQKKSETVFHTHRGLNDILLLVTNCERTLAWPIIKHRRARTWTDVYFGIPDRNQEPLSRTSCWTNFPEIEQDFGKVLSAWRSRFSDHYPAFYLYGGTRRQKRIYTEHKFINLMWGLEALSNPSYKVTRNAALITKIGRITKAISESGLKSSDKSWAIKSTERALKPTLADRLTEILASLSININASKIARFSQRCADARNSLSHEGGARSNALYDDFIQDVFKLSIGLDIIYHLKLLQELGLGNLHIQAILNTIFSSYDVRARLKHADLEPDRLYM